MRAKTGHGHGTQSELNRIREAYRYYDTNASVRARHNPDNAGGRAIGAELQLAVVELVRTLEFPAGGSVCDVGCGTGRNLAQVGAVLTRQKPRLYGIDLLPERIEVARKTLPAANLWVQSAERLPFADCSVHLLIVATVFSSLLDREVAANVAAEMWRVMADGGTIVGYDFRYPNVMNRRTRMISLGRWRRLFPAGSIEAQSITLLPQLARRLGAHTQAWYPKLATIPALRTHYLVRISRAGC